MAAVMSGHTSLVNDVLRQTGAPALAVVQGEWSSEEAQNVDAAKAARAEWDAQLLRLTLSMAPPTTPPTAGPRLVVPPESEKEKEEREQGKPELWL